MNLTKDCNTCVHNGNQSIMPSGCTGCGDMEYKNYMPTIDEIHAKYKPRGDFEAFEVLATDMGDYPYLVRYAFKSHSGGRYWVSYDLDKDLHEVCGEDEYDLIPKEERVTGWVNVYKYAGQDCVMGASIYKTEEAARSFGKDTKENICFATILIDVKRESSDVANQL